MSYVHEIIGANSSVRVTVGRGASAAAVAAAQSSLGVELPDSYRRFLETCGVAQLGHDDIFGIIDNLAAGERGFDFLVATRSLREQDAMQWPRSMIVIASDGRGGDYCLDVSQINNGDCPVVYHDHEMDWFDSDSNAVTPSFETVKPTFAEWLIQIARTGSMLPQ